MFKLSQEILCFHNKLTNWISIIYSYLKRANNKLKSLFLICYHVFYVNKVAKSSRPDIILTNKKSIIERGINRNENIRKNIKEKFKTLLFKKNKIWYVKIWYL